MTSLTLSRQRGHSAPSRAELTGYTLRYITYYPAPYLPLCNLLGSFPYFTDIYPRTE